MAFHPTATGEIVSISQDSHQCHFICETFPLSWPLLREITSYTKTLQHVVMLKHRFPSTYGAFVKDLLNSLVRESAE